MEVKYILGISVLALLTLFAVVWSSMGVSPSFYLQNLQTVTDHGATTNNTITIPNDGLKTVNNTDGAFLVNDGISYTPVLMSGDATMASDGTVTVLADLGGSANSITLEGKVAETGGILKGQVVYISGATGGFADVQLASNSNLSRSGLIGLAIETKASGQTIGLMTQGLLEGIDTTAFYEGQVVYLGVDGAITPIHPVSINAVQRLGNAVKINANTGSILIRINELSTINDHNGTVRMQIANLNTDSRAGSSYTAVNDAGHRISIGIFGSNYFAGSEIAGIYNEGYGNGFNIIDGNHSFNWNTDPTDSHNFSALSHNVMRLSALGNLEVRGDIKVGGDMVSSDGSVGYTGTCATSLVVKNGIVTGCI